MGEVQVRDNGKIEAIIIINYIKYLEKQIDNGLDCFYNYKTCIGQKMTSALQTQRTAHFLARRHPSSEGNFCVAK